MCATRPGGMWWISPGRFRTIGPLSNMPEFAAAFGCEEGDPMVLSDAERAIIW